jgi:ATP synthase protein I
VAIEDGPGPERLDEDARLKSLDSRLKAAEAEEAHRTGKGGGAAQADYRMGNRVLAELLGGMIGGALIGWVIDRFAGTSPWALLVLLFLGIVVAFRNIYRIAQRPK